MKIRFLIFLSLCGLSLGEFHLKYPEVRRDESVLDDYHGVKVADPYRWLEDLGSAECLTFVENQRALYREFLEGLSHRELIRQKLTQLVNYTKISAPITKGPFYTYFYNSGLQGHDILLKQRTLESEPEVLLDPNTLSEDGSISLGYYKGFSQNGHIFVYSLSQKGSDWLTGHFQMVTSGETLPDVIEHIKWPDFSFSHDNAGIFYSRFPVGEDGEPMSSNPQIYYHKLGEEQSQDIFIIDNPEHPQWFLMSEVSHDGNYLLVKPQPDFKSNSVLVASLNGSSLTSEFLPAFSALDEQARFIYVTNTREEFIFLSDKNAPNFHIIRVNINTQTKEIGESSILVAEHERNILKWVAPIHGDKLVLCYFQDVKHKLEVRSLVDGSALYEIPLPDGVISEYSLFRENAEFFFKFENLLNPGTIYRCQFQESCTCQIYKEMSVPSSLKYFNGLSDYYTQKQVFYPSKDGTQIPMFIAHPKDLELNGSAPTLLFGYGGFNVDTLPTFSPFNFAFINHFGGVFASANIRGGAEYGEKWHEGGMALNKQNSFDDFEGAAEYLIREGYTHPSKLAIQGSSNGGLLVGACVNQRPDLFAVALPDVGLMDMLRFQKSTIGFAWCSEYGCSENETDFHNLYSYSPLHNIKLPPGGGNESYPAVLVSTAEHDDRVLPSHSFKYISQLQHIIGHDPRQKNPLIIRITENAGHNGEGTPITHRIDEYADSFAFIADQLTRNSS